MSENELSDSESIDKDSDSGSEDVEIPRNRNAQKLSDYEKERVKRIEENRARMDALGLQKIASSFMGSAQTTKKNRERKGKRKVVEDDDDEYRPHEGEEGLSVSNDEDCNDDQDDDDDEYSFGSRVKKVKKKKTNTTPTKKILVQKGLNKSDSVVDDDDLMKAIALSLQDSAGFLDVNCVLQGTAANTAEGLTERKDGANIQDDTGKRKRKKLMTSRVQMNEDELILHFFQFDESGKGWLTLRDLRRTAAAHDFTWTDKEMADMISCFDNDRDGKLCLDDFRKIVGRCNMLQGSYSNAVTGSKD